MFCVQKATLSKSGKLHRSGSPTPSDASTRASTAVSAASQVSTFNPEYDQLRRYLGGNTMLQTKYESIFGAVSRESPFGEFIWDGLLSYFVPGFVENYGSKYLWCGDHQKFLPWLGAYNMPMKFSKAVSRTPITTVDGLPSAALYPAVFLLTPMQDNFIKSAFGNCDDPLVVVGNGIVDSWPSTDVGMDESDTDLESDTDVSHCIVDSSGMGDVYMVCLKIMISGSKPWQVNMDHIHLYSPFPLSRL